MFDPHGVPQRRTPSQRFYRGTNLSNRRMRDPLVRWCGRLCQEDA